MDESQPETSENPAPEESQPLDAEAIQIEEKTEDEPTGEEEEPADGDKEETTKDILMEYAPWLLAAGIGFLLLIIAVALLASAGAGPFVFPYNPQYFNVPHYQGSMRVLSVDDQPLKYINDMRYIGSRVSTSLRYKIEPKLKYIYSNASMEAENVVVISFKYGGAGETSETQEGRSILGRSTEDGERKKGKKAIVVRHWIYLKENTTLSDEELTANVVAALDKVKGIEVDKTSVALKSLKNMTRLEAIQALTQAGFFKHGLKGLDLGLLDIFGIGLDIQTEGEEEGLCKSLLRPSHGSVSPQQCTASINTYVQMTCKFDCDDGYELVGSPKRVCLTSGLWSGESVRCQKKCQPLKLQSIGHMEPRTCLHDIVSSGQMCFAECPSNSHRMFFPPTSSSSLEVKEKDMWPPLDYDKPQDTAEYNPFDDVKSYFRECGADGRWTGRDASCKAVCPRINPPPNGGVYPEHCLVDTVEGESCTIKCDTGYGLIGGGSSKVITCDVSGKWTREIPVCERLCPVLTASSNMIITPKICLASPHESTSCKYECEAGYLLSGSEERICRNGVWVNSEPTCVAACDSINYPDNGFLLSPSGPCSDRSFPEGTQCSLLCDFGYYPSHNSTTCTSSSDWSVTETDLKCIKTCEAIPLDEFGTWSSPSCHLNHYSSLGFCNLTCHTGTVVGKASITCSADGEWSEYPGKCIEHCRALSAPSGGSMESKTSCGDGTATVNTTCEFSCDVGKGLIGSRILKCETGGLWSDGDAEPTCQNEQQYIVAQFWDDHFICLSVTNDGKLQKIDNIDDSCEEKNARWAIDEDRIMSGFARTCLTANESSTLLHLEECDSSNTNQNFGTAFGHAIELVSGNRYLTSGYRTIDQPQLTDFHRGLGDPTLQWQFYDAASGLSSTSGSLYSIKNSGKCKPELASVLQVSVTPASCNSGPQNAGTTCTLSCSAGSALSDNSQSTATCTSGVWDVDASLHCAKTSPTQCFALATDPSWDITITPSDCTSSQKNPGEKCEIECKNSTVKHLDGPSSVMCLETGRWSYQFAPVCKPRCPRLTLPENSYLITTDALKCLGASGMMSEPGTICTLGCETEYQLVGQSILTCTDDGTWSSEPPKCEQMCQDLSGIEHSSLVHCTKSKIHDKYPSGVYCEIVCDQGYHLGLSSAGVSCQADGSWIFMGMGTMECQEKCPTIVEKDGLVVSPVMCALEAAVVGTECTFSCQGAGYGLEYSFDEDVERGIGSVKRTCMEDKSWSGPVVTCSKRCPALPKIETDNSGFYSPSECNNLLIKPGTKCKLLCQGDDAVYGGQDTLTCGPGGQWTPGDTFGTCSPACEALPTPSHATILPRKCTEGFVEAGTQCAIVCPEYMERLGSGFRECLGSPDAFTGSRWSGDLEPTRCVARCPPISPNLGSYVFPNDCAHRSKIQGDMCTFECTPGYSLSGIGALQCTAAGTWSESVPTCFRPCPPITVDNGDLHCDTTSGSSSYGYGFVYKPGTKCFYSCNAGHTAYEQNEIACDKDGIWNPAPFCSPVSDTFPIIQKIGEVTVCLQASKLGTDGSIDGSEWHLSTTNNSNAGCEAAGNNAMWFWYNSLNIKHAETGLCLTAESALIDASLLLQRCDVTNKLQHWDCDSEHPYRFILKDTPLSIDTMYKELGPVLQSKTHAETYWITFNSVLETTGTVCSNKAVGACPPIRKRFMKLVPEICTTDDVMIWQQCAASCEDGSLFDGATDIVECQPTGEWENLEKIHCRRNCPVLPKVEHGKFDQESCTEDASIHQSICSLSCDDGYVLSTDASESPYVCEDGMWVGDEGIVRCIDKCKDLPEAPENGNILCRGKVCNIICDAGYKVKGNWTGFDCTEDHIIPNDTCVEEYHFRLQLQTTVFSKTIATCMKVFRDLIIKVPCFSPDPTQYWKWLDSAEVVDEDYSMLMSIASGLCMAASSDSEFAQIILKPCDETDELQQWTCHNHLFPGRFGLVSDATTYVDAGYITENSPPLLRKDTAHLRSADWLAIDTKEHARYACGSRRIGACPVLPIGPFTAVEPLGCSTWDGLPIGTKCKTHCSNSDYELANGESEHTIRCQSTGAWNEDLQLCVAKSSATGTCEAFTMSIGMQVSPQKCAAGSGEEILAGELCKFSCDPGFYLKGAKEVICKSGVTWTAPEPACVPFCPGIKPELGVNVTDAACVGLTAPEGTECEIECADGFVPADDSPTSITATCNSKGTWNKPYINCEYSCPPLSGNPSNATHIASELEDPDLYRSTVTSLSCAEDRSRLRSLCEFSCPDGNVTVFGESEITCNAGGIWSGRTPRCVPEFYCPEVTETESTKANYDNLLDEKAVFPGTVVKIHCAEGFIPDGDDVRKCKVEGLWGGEGPTVPQCVKKCPPLITPFATEIEPKRCTTGWVEDGLGCTYHCADETVFADRGTKLRVECSNGEWSHPAPQCLVRDPNDIDNLNVYNDDGGFLIITRTPESGCLHAGSDNTVRWRPAAECDPRQMSNRWKWYDSQQLMTFLGELCMQPENPFNPNSTLIVGKCNATASFGCGNPRSLYFKYTMYSFSSPQWRLAFTTHPYTGLPYEVFTVKAETISPDLPKDIYEGLNVYGNVDVMSPRTTDKSVCEYMCGGAVHFDNDYKPHVITSPGFIHNQEYPANSHCKWDIFGHGRIITLTLQELDLKGGIASTEECVSDCLTIYEGDGYDTVLSEKVAVYSGNDIRSQHPIVIRSISPFLHIEFVSDGTKQGRGFALQYVFEDLPSPQGICGHREKYENDISSEGTTEVRPGLRGNSANIEKWPWLVSIREKYWGSSKAYHRCTGALISSEVVITAAHCTRFVVQKSASTVDIGIGMTLQNDMDRAMRNLTREPLRSMFHVYHGYNSVTRDGDIAIWRLNQPVTLGDRVFPICLPDSGYRVHEPKSTCYSAGWNSLTQGINLNQIMEYEVQTISSTWCKEILGLNKDSSFACGENINFDISGIHEKTESEPLMCNHNGNWYLSGIRSYTHIGAKDTYRLYTEVHRYADWIGHTINTMDLYYTSQGGHLVLGGS
uniref:sushi, von Willebrand factor type A, EGF and pentraxin domain-containing protein 1-like n=1 Tax=Styela clava TaxID=7725 RepID=UPI00193A1CE4|nr:sushi, von Willebrand factor type A, EGF and pentraxin domain-containing protein 1-like [Styela clava]